MDPLSATASIIAILGAVRQLTKGTAKLASLRGAPEAIIALHHESANLHVVTIAIQGVLNQQKASGVPLPEHQLMQSNVDSGIIKSLKQANSTLSKLYALFKRLKVSTSESTDVITFDRVIWLREQRSIKRLKKDLKSVGIQLTTALGALNASTLLRLETHARVEHQRQTRTIEQIEVNQIHGFMKTETGVQNLHQKINQLQAIQSQQQDRLELSINTTDAAKITRMIFIDGPNSAQTLASPSNIGQGFKSTQSIQVPMRASHLRCTKGCPCICHRRQMYKTPQVLDRFFGILSVGFAGIPRVTPPCDSAQCTQRSTPTVLISLFFPPWLLARALIIVGRQSPTNGPELILRVPRIVSDNALIFDRCAQNDIPAVRELLHQGLASTLDVRCTTGKTPLHTAIEYSNTELCRALLDMGADAHYEDYRKKNGYDQAWKIILGNRGDKYARNMLQALFPGDDFIEDEDLSLLHRTVLSLNYLDLDDILASGPKSAIDKRDASGRTALWWATLRADYQAAATLLSHRANINIPSNSGYTPLDAAIQSQNQELITLFLEHHCNLDRDPDGWLPFHSCTYYGSNLDVLKIMLNRGIEINSTTTSTNITALMMAVQERHYEVCEFLIAEKADLDKVDHNGDSALHLAIQFNSHQAMRLLLQNGADYRLKSNAGETLLHHAAQFGDMECLSVLYTSSLGAINPEDRVTGSSPSQRFKEMKNQDALQIAGRRDDASTEWHHLFRELIDVIKYPERREDQFHDALEHLES